MFFLRLEKTIHEFSFGICVSLKIHVGLKKLLQMKKIITAVILLISTATFSQDTIRMMQYNVLNFGVYDSYCTTTNNNIIMKDSCLRTIIKYVKPDIFTANEIDADVTIHKRILDSCLNVDGITYYKRCNYSNLNTSSTLTNQLFYNSNKLGFFSQINISTTVRDINIYKLYYKANDLSITHDTAFITRIVVDLKAGNYASDESERATETSKLMNYLIATGVKGNYSIGGDFNVYSDTETCFQHLINPIDTNFRFNDPVNMLGDWHDNSQYVNYHSQSTHTSSGCAASGGLDDRFDYILISNYLKNGSKHFQYIPGSYTTVGQDGNHFNQALNSGTNASAPNNVIQALYNMSDHLPITLEFKVDQTVGIRDIQKPSFEVVFQNPVNGNIDLTLLTSGKENFKLAITNILGQQLFSKIIEVSGNIANTTLPTCNLNKGIYFLKLTDSKNNSVVKKFVKE